MPDLSSVPITQRWPASHPDRLQPYAAPTPNGSFLRWGGKDCEDKRPRQRFADEAKPLLGILDRRLEGRDWSIDGYSIVDIATLGRVNALVESFDAGDIRGLSNFANIQAWLGRGLARPAVQRGLHIPARPA